MVRRYLHAAPHRPARPAAATRLIETYDAALARIAEDTRSWLTHPRPYPELARARVSLDQTASLLVCLAACGTASDHQHLR